jgi:hypothetical protein
MSRLAFYLEALDRDVRKAHEQPVQLRALLTARCLVLIELVIQGEVDLKTPEGKPPLLHRTVSFRRCIFSMQVAANAVQPV